jgi:hypothetical protein
MNIKRGDLRFRYTTDSFKGRLQSAFYESVEMDPLDLEILERAFDATWTAVKAHDFDSDEGLEALLRRELIEIACFNGVSDPETLRDILLANLPPNATD